jgi:hypothetical protein
MALQPRRQPSSGDIALMMEAARTSETLVNFYQTTWRYNSEDSHFVFTAVRTSNPTFK